MTNHIGFETTTSFCQLTQFRDEICRDLNSLKENWISELTNGKKGFTHSTFFENAFSKILNSTFDGSGKLLRPLLTFWTATLLSNGENQSQRELKKRLASSVEILHIASLIHDDIADESEERRGSPSAHVTYGVGPALNFASWLYFKAIEHLKSPHLMKLANDILIDCHVGQGLDIQYTKTAIAPSDVDDLEALYLTIAERKTARLFQLATLGVTEIYNCDVKVKTLLSEAMRKLGTAFQIQDDVKNFMHSESGMKTFEDLNGPFRNFVIIRLFAELSEDEKEIAERAIRNNQFQDYLVRCVNFGKTCFEAQFKASALLNECRSIVRDLAVSEHSIQEFEKLLSVMLKPFSHLNFEQEQGVTHDSQLVF